MLKKELILLLRHVLFLTPVILPMQVEAGLVESSLPGQIHNQGPIIFQNVRVFDGIHPQLIENASVLVDYVRKPNEESATKMVYGYDIGYFIKEVSKGKPIESAYDKSRVRIIDGGNRVLMPGLIDTHVHLS